MTTGKRVQRIGHETAEANAFTGLIREITVDLGKKVLRVHDGLIPGGSILGLEDLSSSPAAVGGVNDGKMTASQATELTNATANDVVQDSRLDGIDTLNTTQDGRLTSVEGVNATQDGRLSSMDTLNTTQDGRLDAFDLNISAMNTLNITQTNRLNAIDVLDITQTGRLTVNEANILLRLLSSNNLSDVANAGTARANLSVDIAGTDNSVNVTLLGETYLAITGQAITAQAINMANQVSGVLPVANGGTDAINPANARINLGAAPTVSPAFTGAPTAPTALIADDSIQIATTAFVQAAIAPPVYSTYVTSTNMHIYIGNSNLTSLDVTGITTYQSIGPTGSGAANIWTALNALPTTAVWVKIRIDLSMASSISGILLQRASARVTGSTTAQYNAFTIGEQQANDVFNIDTAGFECTVPVDSSGRFDLIYESAGASLTVEIADIYMLGFGT